MDPGACRDCTAAGDLARGSDPIALVSRLQRGSGMPTWPNQILVATDFSDGSDEALDKAIEVAKQAEAEVELLHVLELGADTFPYGLAAYDDHAGLLKHIESELQKRAARVADAGVTVTTKMVEGAAPAEIVQRARKIRADVIVVGTHGRTGLSHVLLGSVAGRVVQKSACAVLTIPFSRREA